MGTKGGGAGTPVGLGLANVLIIVFSSSRSPKSNSKDSGVSWKKLC